MKIPGRIIFMAFIIFTCACATFHSEQEEERIPFLNGVRNAEYPVDGTRKGRVRLRDGYFEERTVLDEATKCRIWLGRHRVLGDLNNDGSADAAVTLIVDYGGSGLFTYLAAVMNKEDKITPVDTVLVGDRIIVRSLSIREDEIIISIFTHGPGEPMASEPTLKVKKKFRLRDNRLVEFE